ncbi:MAG: hypothetical protein ACHQ53_09160 [Polyangiales bacterium]
MRRWAAVLVLVGFSGCPDADRAVPFKRGETVAEQPTSPSALGASAPRPEGNGEAQAGSAPNATGALSFPKGTARVEVAAHSLTLATATGGVRAALALPDAGTQSVLLVLEDPSGALSLARSQLAGAVWSAPQGGAALGETGGATGCTLDEAGLAALDASYVVIDAKVTCSRPSQPAQPKEAPAPAGAPAAHGERHLWIASNEHAPRVLEHVATLSPENPGQPAVTPAVRSVDLDADGNTDLLLDLDVVLGDVSLGRPGLKLYNRAGGLARDGAEPEKTLLALADQAKTERRRNPTTALDFAQRALAIHGALCREGGAPRLRIGTTRGLDCGPSLGAGRAASVVCAVLASQGKLLDALECTQGLERASYRLTDNDRDRARSALSTRVDAQAYDFRAGPAIEPTTSPRARHGAVAFADDTHLLLRGTPARSYDLGTSTIEPTGVAAPLAVVDPSGRMVVSSIVRSCEGYRLGIVLATQLLAGVVAGPNVAEPLIAAAEPPPGAHCPELTHEQKNDQGGLRLIEWTAQGVLLARQHELLLLALDAAGKSVVEARVLGTSEPTPALPRSSELSADGRYLVLGTALGIALLDRKQGTTRLIAAPGGAAAVTDLAVSPSANAIAVVQDGKLFIGVARQAALAPAHASAPAPAPAPASTPTPAPRELPPAPPGTPP